MAGSIFTLGHLTLASVTVLLFSLSFLQSVNEGLILIPIVILLVLAGLVIAKINEFLVCLVRPPKGAAVYSPATNTISDSA